MIQVIGREGCPNCEATKILLNNKQIRFEYILLEDMSSEAKAKVEEMAIEKGMLELPIILKDNRIVTRDELIYG